MPHSDSARVNPGLHIDRRGELPITRFLDFEDSMTIELIQGFPDTMGKTIYEFARACHSHSPSVYDGTKHSDDILDEVLSGKALWQTLEIMPLMFRITNVSRVFSHQLVRQRIGVTFSQQCTGEQDLRHFDYVIPRNLNPEGEATYTSACLNAKMAYADLMESGVSTQEARFVLPQCLTTFIYMNASLGTIAALYQRRQCTMTQSWEMVVFAEKLKQAVLNRYPKLKSAFRETCKDGMCWYNGAKDNYFSVSNYFAPDKVHDTFEWNRESYYHDGKTHREVSSGDAANNISFYNGRIRVDEAAYWERFKNLHVAETVEQRYPSCCE